MRFDTLCLHGGTYTMFNDILPQFGIKARLVDGTKPEDFADFSVLR